jgi:hypothetical protein
MAKRDSPDGEDSNGGIWEAGLELGRTTLVL